MGPELLQESQGACLSLGENKVSKADKWVCLFQRVLFGGCLKWGNRRETARLQGELTWNQPNKFLTTAHHLIKSY